MAARDSGKAASPWTAHRRRAEALSTRHPFAAQVLGVYVALLDVWTDAWDLTGTDRPDPRTLAGWAAERVLPQVVKATEASGPEALGTAARERLEAGDAVRPLAAWLAGGELEPVDRYLARASLRAPLEALGADAGAACADQPSTKDGRHCPYCGGAPQLSFRGAAGDPLVSGGRRLACARCGQSWSYSASSCPSCAETSGARRTVYAEQRDGPVVGRGGTDRDADKDGDRDADKKAGLADAPAPTFPHLRIESCASCRRYLIDVDLGGDPGAVPEVDELAALPLDLFAAEHGLSKITPNLMGF
jgi:FdhE protein